ncbi:hypothetical protein BDV33DRAFT_186286, partial [Aspergillus novoparasiticus]
RLAQIICLHFLVAPLPTGNFILSRLGFMLDFNHRNIIRIQGPHLFSSLPRFFPTDWAQLLLHHLFSSACPQTLEVR